MSEPADPRATAVMPTVPLEVWTDGACSGNPGPGGWGWITNESEPRTGNGWRNSKKQPVANRDLWEQLVPLTTAPGVTFRWVKGHANHRLNEAADALAVAARDAART